MTRAPMARLAAAGIALGCFAVAPLAGCRKQAEDEVAMPAAPAQPEGEPAKKREDLTWSDVQKEFKALEKERLDVIRMVQEKAGGKAPEAAPVPAPAVPDASVAPAPEELPRPTASP